MSSPTPARRRRGGFTLIELLVVLAILGVLAALTAAAVMGLIGARSHKNTEALLQKLDPALQQQWSEAQKRVPDAIPAAVQTLAAPDPDGSRARTIWKKLWMVREFPMSYAEARQPWLAGGNAVLGPADLPAVPEYVTKLQGKNADISLAGLPAVLPW